MLCPRPKSFPSREMSAAPICDDVHSVLIQLQGQRERVGGGVGLNRWGDFYGNSSFVVGEFCFLKCNCQALLIVHDFWILMDSKVNLRKVIFLGGGLLFQQLQRLFLFLWVFLSLLYHDFIIYAKGGGTSVLCA